jgi:hypothetical protein
MIYIKVEEREAKILTNLFYYSNYFFVFLSLLLSYNKIELNL